MKKVLSLLSSGLGYGGIASYIGALYSNASEYDVDLTVYVSGSVVDHELKRRLENQGVRVIAGEDSGLASGFCSSLLRHFNLKRKLSDVISMDQFDVVHVNSGWPWFQMTSLSLAKKRSIPVRIAHSHALASSKEARRPFHIHCLRRIKQAATIKAACSNAAGEYMFGKDEWKESGIVLKNGIDVARFSFSDNKRKKARSLGKADDDMLVVGYTGRLTYSKNLRMIVEVFSSIKTRIPNALLWIIGDGEDRGIVESLIAERGLQDHVELWGNRNDVELFLSGMDVFLFPSLWEGLGISVVEAEASGLPCVVSDAVPNDIDFSGCVVRHLSLEEDPEQWAKAVMDVAGRRDTNGAEHVLRAGFDVGASSKDVWRLYDAELGIS